MTKTPSFPLRQDDLLNRHPYWWGIFSVIEGIKRGQEYFRDYIITKMIEKLDKRGRFSGFNNNQTRDLLQVVWDKIMHEIGGNMKERTRGVD